MLDITQRQALMESLRQRSKKASSNVSTKVEANKGDYSVIITSDTIDHFFKGASVGKIRVAEFNDELIELINSNPQEAAQEMLEAFAGSFDKDSFEKNKTKEASVKTAAHETLDEHTWQMTTQKQLDDQKPSLHPRKDEFPKTVTQKQLPEAGMRPGTYEQITEAQLTNEKKTFYNEPLDAAKRIGEDRNIVTEGQFDKKLSEFTDHAQSDRGEMGAKFDGDLEKQHKIIGEKQIMELLKHHEWTEPLTTTEGKDQLGKQDGELSRITAEVAEKIIRESLNAMGNTVLAAGVTPDNLISTIKKLVSHSSKYHALADTISRFANSDVKPINDKVAKAQYFGKVANANQNWNENIIADVLVRQLSKLSYNPKFIVDALVALTKTNDFSQKINKAADNILSNTKTTEETDNLNVFSQVLNGEHNKPNVSGTADDGLYEYTGTIEEIKVASENRDEFIKAASNHAKTIIKANIPDNKNVTLQPLTIDVNEDLGTFKVQFKDASFQEKPLEKETLKSRAESRRNKKEAQFGGAGGAPPAGGPQMGNPMAPPGGADMNAAPPGEAFSQEPPPPPGEEGMGEEEMGGGGEPKPPGTICPVDGSEDVDIDNGDFRCNSCGAEGTIHVRLDITKWPETIHETGEGQEEPGFGLGSENDQELEGEEPLAGGEGSGTTMPNVPVAASVRVTPLLLEKIAKQNITLGSICPNCGGKNTDSHKSASQKGQHGICYDCMQEYNFQIKANRKKAHNVFAQYIWTPKTGSVSCNSCNRLQQSFIKSLNDYGMQVDEFEKLSMKDKAPVILKMAESGTLNLALDTPLQINKYAASFKQKFDKFPSASCVERIARKFGENATSMSGPCQGKPLADCVCRQLEGLGIYTDGLAAKVAMKLSSKDPIENNPSETCVRMFMKDYPIKQACIICDGLRAFAATDDELIIEAIAQFSPSAKPMGAHGLNTPKPMDRTPQIKHDPLGKKTKPMPNMGNGLGMNSPKPMPGMSPMLTPPKPTPKPMGSPGMGGGMSGGMGGGMNSPKPMGMGDSGGGMSSPGMSSPMNSPKPMGDEGMEGGGSDPLGEMGGPETEHIDINLDGGSGDMSGGMGGEIDGLGGELANESIGNELGDEFVDNDGFGGEDNFDDMGLDNDKDVVTIIVDGLQSIVDALRGGIGDEMIDMGNELGGGNGEESGESNGIGEEAGETGLGEEIGESSEESPEGDNPFANNSESSESEGGDSEIPGVMNESDEGSDDLKKEGDPSEMSSPMNKKPSHQQQNEKPEEHSASSNSELQKTASINNEKTANELDRMLHRMKSGTISRSSDSLDNLIDGLMSANPNLFNKQADKADGIKKTKSTEAKEGKLTEQAAQDTKEIGKIKNNQKMGHEEAFNVKGPDVPRGDALMGEEDSEVKVNDSDRPSVPHGSGTMDGEGNFKPEKGNVVDGNQGGQKAAQKTNVKIAAKSCPTCSKEKCSCSCKGCAKPMAQCKCASKTTLCSCPTNCSCKSSGSCNGSCKCNKTASVKKESQTVSPKSVKNLEDDPDLNKSSGPGKGKTHADETHSLGVDEKKPSEGLNEPKVPEAPNGGQLKREHTYDNKLDGPTIPAGGGMNPDYDQNEKNTPEKLDETLGKQNDIAASAEIKSRAIKIAGNMLKSQKITVDELPNKIAELSKLSSSVLDDYENMMKEASLNSKKGMKQAATGAVETSFQLNGSGSNSGPVLKDDIQSLFRLDRNNKDYEKHIGGNTYR